MNTFSRRVYQPDFQSGQFGMQPLPASTGHSERDGAISVFVFYSLTVSSSALLRRLDAFPGARIVGKSAEASHAVAMLRCSRAQLVIISSEDQSIEGIEAIRRIKNEFFHLPILVLSSSKSGGYAQACFRAGASGYCLSSASPSRLALAINSVSDGAAWIDPELSAPVLRPVPCRPPALDARPAGVNSRELPLSDRELQVLRLIADGMSNPEVAADLIVSPETVKTHIKHIMEKLAVNDRTQAVAQAIRLGLVT